MINLSNSQRSELSQVERYDNERVYSQAAYSLSQLDLLFVFVVGSVGAICGLCLSVVVVVVLDVVYPAWWLLASSFQIAIVCIAGGAFFALASVSVRYVSLLQASYSETERSRHREQSRDKTTAKKMTQVVQPVVLEVWNTTSNGLSKTRYELPFVDFEQWQSISRHVLATNKFSQTSLSEFVTSNEYSQLRQELVQAGILYQVDRRGAVEVSGVGRALMRKAIEAGTID